MVTNGDSGLEGLSSTTDAPEGGGTENNYDPFGKDVQQATLIAVMKVYDVLMTILMDSNSEAALKLDDLHSAGIVMGLGPQFSHFAQRDNEVLQSNNEEPDPNTT